MISQGDYHRPRQVDRSVPVDLEAICLRAMELDVKRRYQSARELREDLDRWHGGVELPIAAHGGRMGRIVRGSRYAIRRHKLAAVACAALLVGASAGAFAWLGSGQDDALAIRPYQSFANGGMPAIGDEIVSVSRGDSLGVIIETPEPIYVYVLSIYGQPKPPTWLRLMALQLVDFKPRGDEREVPEFHPFGDTRTSSILVPPGVAKLLCTNIGDYDPADPYEGLWVFTSRQPHAALEAWLDALDLEAHSTGHGVEYETARSLFADAVAGGAGGPLTRGSSPAPLSRQQAQGLAASLDAAMVLGESEWPYDDPKPWRRMWPVEP